MAKLTPADLEFAAMQSWDAVVKMTTPNNKSYDLVALAMPEAIDAHKKLVSAIVEHKGDLRLAIPAATAGKFKRGDWGEATDQFHQRLARFLVEWASKRGL